MLCLLSSCNNGTLPIYFENTATEKVSIEILIPRSSDLKYNVSSLGLLQVKNSLSNQKISGKLNDEEINLTQDFIDEALQSNYDGFFSEADIRTSLSILELNDSIETNNTFNWEYLKTIAGTFNIDALFFVNNLIINFNLSTKESMDNSGNFYPEDNLQCTSAFYYTILYPKEEEFETVVSNFSDNFTLDSYYYSSRHAKQNRTKKIKEILPYICFENGKNAITKFSPTWITVSRDFYGKASRELREAKKYVYNGAWDKAIELWTKNIKNKNLVIAKHAKFNLILAEELTGSIENAILLAEKHYLNYKELIALNYKNILEKRLLQNKQLKNQLSQ